MLPSLLAAAFLPRTPPPPSRLAAPHAHRAARPPTLSAAPLEVDVVVVGAGIGGLSCAALLSKHGQRVLLCEAHDAAGGCAHSFTRRGYTFDSGPSLWSGCAAPSANPLRQVLDAIDESPAWAQYDGWCMYTEDGAFYARCGDEEAFKATLLRLGGEAAAAEWGRLRLFVAPLAKAVLALPPIALRADLAAAGLALPWLPRLADPTLGLRARLLSGPWSRVLAAAGCSNVFLKRWFDFLAFAFSGLPSEGTVAAAMVTPRMPAAFTLHRALLTSASGQVYMMSDLYADGAKMDYPIGGSGAVVDALVRGIEKFGGQVMLRTRVERIEMEGGRAVGVRTAAGQTIRCRHVVSNAPVWATAKLLPEEVRRELLGGRSAVDESIPPTPSFIHLHLGIRAEGLSEQALASIHHIVVPSWDNLMEPQSTVFVSIPSLIDPSLAPEGRHVIHAYLPATEPYALWEGLDRSSSEYAELKRERSNCLYAAIERFIPDIRDRVEVELIGSPLTHERFLNRYKGTYGPELVAGTDNFPGARTPVPGLLCCGDSTWPGIGVPAVAGSGMAAAHAIASPAQQKKLLEDMKRRNVLIPAPFVFGE